MPNASSIATTITLLFLFLQIQLIQSFVKIQNHRFIADNYTFKPRISNSCIISNKNLVLTNNLILGASSSNSNNLYTTQKNGRDGEVVGSTGRIGSFILRQGEGYLAPVLRGVCPGYQSQKGTPIYVSVPNSSVLDVIRSTKESRKSDLVLIGNYLLPEKFIQDCTICVPHFAIKTVGSNPLLSEKNEKDPPPTYVYGKFTDQMKEIFNNKNKSSSCSIPIEMISALEEMYVIIIKKLMWSSIFWLLCNASTPPLDVVSVHECQSLELRKLLTELRPAANLLLEEYLPTKATTIDIGTIEEIENYFVSYSYAMPGVVPSQDLGRKEVMDRNMRFLAFSNSKLPQPFHETLLKKIIGEQEFYNILNNIKSKDDTVCYEKTQQYYYISQSSNLAFLYQKHLKQQNPEKALKKIIIVGSGFIGSSIAAQLAQSKGQKNIEIHVFDKLDITNNITNVTAIGNATESSWAWINANRKYPKSYQYLNQLGMHVWRWNPIMKSLAIWSGSLIYQKSENVHTVSDGSYFSVGPITSLKELQELQPNCLLPFENENELFYYPDEGHVDPYLAVERLREYAKEKIKFHGNVHIRKLIKDEQGVTIGVLFNSGNKQEIHYADLVIVTAGVGASEKNLQCIPMLYKPGHLAYATTFTTNQSQEENNVKSSLLQRIIVDTVNSYHVLQRGNQLVIGGGSLEFGGTSSTSSILTQTNETISSDDIGKAMLQTLKSGNSLVKSCIKYSSYSHVTMADRPIPKDGYPAIGSIDPGLYVVVTHSGITLGLLLADLATQEILQNYSFDVLDQYRPNRFQ